MNIRIIEIALLVFASLIILIGLILHYTNMPLYDLFVKEDHFLEWLQFLFLFITCILCFYRSYALYSNTQNTISVLMFFFGGILFLFGAGEEISWGQRILGLETPEYFEEYNAQEEMNLHNLTVMGIKINKLIFGKILAIVILTYLIILPILENYIDWLRRIIQQFHIPFPKLMHSVFFVILVGLLYSLDPERKGELVEFVGVFTFFLIFLFPKYGVDLQRAVNRGGSDSSHDSVK